MAIVRFSTDEVFSTDSQEYEVLANAVSKIKGVPGAVVEIGTRRGGSAKIIIDTLVANQDAQGRSMFCIDPYGNIEIPCTHKNISTHYPHIKIDDDPQSLEKTVNCKFDYDTNMRNRIVPSLYYYAFNAGINFTFFLLEDHEFFKRYSDGVPIYDEGKRIEDKYAFVFFDGPHDYPALERETNFFIERSVPGTMFVYDDVWMYDHPKLEHDLLFKNGFVVLEQKNIKMSYVKK